MWETIVCVCFVNSISIEFDVDISRLFVYRLRYTSTLRLCCSDSGVSLFELIRSYSNMCRPVWITYNLQLQVSGSMFHSSWLMVHDWLFMKCITIEVEFDRTRSRANLISIEFDFDMSRLFVYRLRCKSTLRLRFSDSVHKMRKIVH